MLREARAVLPGDAVLEKLWMTRPSNVPSRAIRPAPTSRSGPTAETPISSKPLGRLRFERPACPRLPRLEDLQTGFSCDSRDRSARRELEGSPRPGRTVPPEMVRVPGQKRVVPYMPGLDQAPEAQIDDYLIDRHEVTNEEYKTFVDAGGYANRQFWRDLSSETTDNPLGAGPGRLSRCDGPYRPGDVGGRILPEGLERHPVAGVSWYEAAAYAAFAARASHHLPLESGRAAQVRDRDPPRKQLRSGGTRPVGEPGT